MRSVTYDSRRPCVPLVTPSSPNRETLHLQALRLEAASIIVESGVITPQMARELFYAPA